MLAPRTALKRSAVVAQVRAQFTLGRCSRVGRRHQPDGRSSGTCCAFALWSTRLPCTASSCLLVREAAYHHRQRRRVRWFSFLDAPEHLHVRRASLTRSLDRRSLSGALEMGWNWADDRTARNLVQHQYVSHLILERWSAPNLMSQHLGCLAL